jgi:hypothetical protein
VLHAHLLDDVHAKGIKDVTEVVHVQLASAIPIVDGADLLDLISVLNKRKLFVVQNTFRSRV